MTVDFSRIFKKPSCEDVTQLSMAYGFGISALGLDQMFSGFGAPPAVHWALGGVAAEKQCKGQLYMNEQLAMSMAAGFAGGLGGSFLFGR